MSTAKILTFAKIEFQVLVANVETSRLGRDCLGNMINLGKGGCIWISTRIFMATNCGQLLGFLVSGHYLQAFGRLPQEGFVYGVSLYVYSQNFRHDILWESRRELKVSIFLTSIFPSKLGAPKFVMFLLKWAIRGDQGFLISGAPHFETSPFVS